MKELKRSCKFRIFTGVCGGIGQYFNIDPVIIRLLAIILVFVTKGLFVIFYIAASIIMPSSDDFFEEETPESSENCQDTEKTDDNDEEFNSYFS